MINPGHSLNILFLASWYPTRVEPQNGNFIQRHAEAVSLNCNVACLHVFSIPGIKGFEIDAQWRNNVFEVIVYFGKTGKYFPLRKINRYLKAHRLGFKKVLEVFQKIDLVHLNVFFPAGIFALELQRKYSLPFVITEHWTAFLDINPHAFNWFEKFYIIKTGKGAACICPVSYDLKKAIENMGIPGPYKIIPNVVDTNLFHLGKRRDFTIKKILHVSTLNDQHKNVIGILRVTARLQKERQDFKLTLAGNKYGDLHHRHIDQLGIQKELVEIHEEIPLEAIAAMMQEHHIFVLFSNYENLPCVISEAQASGMVVLATDVGGVNEMIDAKNGLLIKAKDEEALYKQLNSLLDRLDDYDPQEISRSAKARYSYQSVADQYLEVYQSTLE